MDTHMQRQMRYANTRNLACAAGEGQKYSDGHARARTVTNRPRAHSKSISSENTRKHTLGHATHTNEHAEDISINILSGLNSNANICGHCCDELREHFTQKSQRHPIITE